MSQIMSSSLNLTIFTVDGVVPVGLDMFTVLSANLEKFAFKDIQHSREEQSVGWVSPSDKNSVDFAPPEFVWINEYVFLSLRKDVRKVPSAVLKQEIAECTNVWLQDHSGFKRPPKAIREEISDAAKLSLLDKTLPVPKVVDAIWDTATGKMFVLSASTAELDLFCDMFHRSFDGFHISMLPPFQVAAGAAVQDKVVYDLLAASNKATTASLLDDISSNVWLGQEFALWLLAGLSCSGNGISAWIGDKLALAGGGKKAVFSGDVTENMTGVKAALNEGKQISDAMVYIEDKDGMVFRLTLNTETFAIKGIKLPPVRVEYDEQESNMLQAEFLLRVDAIKSLLSHLFGSLLYAFLSSYLRDTVQHNADIADFLGV